MKKNKISNLLMQLVMLVAIVLLFTQCRNDAKVDRGISTFFATLVFMIFMIVGGIPSIVFSALSVKSPQSSMRVIAIVFVSIFGLCSLISMPMYSEFWRKGAREWIGFIAFIQYASLITSVVLIGIGINNKNKIAQSAPKVAPKKEKPSDDIDYIDEILND